MRRGVNVDKTVGDAIRSITWFRSHKALEALAMTGRKFCLRDIEPSQRFSRGATQADLHFNRINLAVVRIIRG